MKKADIFNENLREAEGILVRRDKLIGRLINRYGPCGISPHSKYFETLVGAIISQQLSTKVADVIFARFKAIYGPGSFPKPEAILKTSDEAIRSVGLSASKVSFIKDLALKTDDGTLKLRSLSRKSDDEIIEMLTEVKGIGIWTAHMFLIFCLGRLDILPVGDYGIRKAIQSIYTLEELPKADLITELAEKRKWRPYCSIVSWYLWKSLDNKT